MFICNNRQAKLWLSVCLSVYDKKIVENMTVNDSQEKMCLLMHTVNVDCVKFEYVVLAKYHHMLIFEFDLLTKQQILILCKKLL